MILCMKAEKTFEKIQIPFLVLKKSNISKLGMYLKTQTAIYQKPEKCKSSLYTS